MSAPLRIMLILCSLVMILYVWRKIKKAGMRMENGIIWLLASIVFLIISIWPEIIYKVCKLFGIMSPTNLVYLLVIAFLLLLVFYNAIKISTLESRLDHLAQEIALRDQRFIGMETEEKRILREQEQEQHQTTNE